MKLVYDVVEDVYDDTTQIRTMTEQGLAVRFLPNLGDIHADMVRCVNSRPD